MKINHFQRIALVFLVFSLFDGLFFGNVSRSYAQSSQTWSDAINLSNSGSASNPLLVTDADGGMHVIWDDLFDGYKYAESIDGVTWTTPENVNFPFSPQDDSRPTFVASPNGTIHIFWIDRTGALYYSQAQSADFGNPGAWSEKLQLTDSAVDFNAVVDLEGTLHFTYVRKVNSDFSPSGVYYRRLGASGWSTLVNLYSSQYFRSLNAEDAHVHIAVSSGSKPGNVYVVWDDRLQKRIFMARSLDGGRTWGKTSQVRGPEDSSGAAEPFNINVSATNDNVLLMWQIGQPGGLCTQYSQWSTDGGDHFADPIKPLDEFVSCPDNIDFIAHNTDFSVALLTFQNDISLIAWNGSRWSKLQPQNELSTFSNPVTFDNVIFGCPSISVYSENLYVVGCDKGSSGDIWLRSRALGSFEEWFPPPSAWTAPVRLTNVAQKISSLSSVVDYKQDVHVFWVQIPLSETDNGHVTIQYAKWDGEEWSKPSSIFTDFDSIPSQLSLAFDNHTRLFLLWVEGQNGDIYFSWANADRANLASEWAQPERIPTPFELHSSPCILVDSSGKIAVAYAVPLNENRGVYLVQSDDLGKNWSQPVRVFDAIAAQWDSVDQPVISLSEDGKLHLLFSRYSLREDNQTVGLYYSQSSDGGTTWSQPETVSEKPIQWSRFVSFGNQTLHRIWQENDNLSNDIFHQISRDGGVTWENPVKVSSVRGNLVKAALATDWSGNLYMAQAYAESKNLILQVSEWNGSRWDSLESKEIDTKVNDFQYSIGTGIASQGILNIIVSIDDMQLVDGFENEIITFNRSLGLSSEDQSPASWLIATPVASSIVAEAPEIQSIPTESSPLAGLYDSPIPSYKNLVGVLLVGGVLCVIVLYLIVTRSRRKRESG